MQPENQQELNTAPTALGQLPKEILQNVFRQGVLYSWPDPDEDMDDSSSVLSSEGDVEEHEWFTSKRRQPFFPLELETIMNCAMVCRGWADAVLDLSFWEQNHLLPYVGGFLEPWWLGSRWNKFFTDVPVSIPCSQSHLLASVGKIELSASVGRTRFDVCFPVRTKRRKNIDRAWRVLRSHLWKYCTHLELISHGEDDEHCIDLGDVIFKPWPRLQSLKLGTILKSIVPSQSMENLIRLSSTPGDDFKQNPLFPALRFMAFHTHPNGHIAREVLLIAPNIEECRMDTYGMRSDPVPGWGIDRNSIAHAKFLEEDKRFRTYVTPFCMYAFKWPGPKRLDGCSDIWRLKALLSHSPEYGIFISETRDGGLCELHMSLDDFFAIEDLTALDIPMSRSPSL